MSQQFQEHQGVSCQDHPNPRPVRTTPPAPAIDRKEESAARTARDLALFLCLAGLMVLALNGLRGMLP